MRNKKDVINRRGLDEQCGPCGRLWPWYKGLTLLFSMILLFMQPVPALCAERHAEDKERTSRQSAAPTEKKHKKPARKLRPFTPSERIGADQAVAFPVDI
jgi:hypothetical protein